MRGNSWRVCRWANSCYKKHDGKFISYYSALTCQRNKLHDGNNQDIIIKDTIYRAFDTAAVSWEVHVDVKD